MKSVRTATGMTVRSAAKMLVMTRYGGQ